MCLFVAYLGRISFAFRRTLNVCNVQLTIVKRTYNVFVTRIFSLYAQRTSVYMPMCDAGISG